MSKVSIVIPCYFNELNVAETYKVLVRDVFEKRKDIEFEITPFHQCINYSKLRRCFLYTKQRSVHNIVNQTKSRSCTIFSFPFTNASFSCCLVVT